MSLRIGGTASYQSTRDLGDRDHRENSEDSYLERLVKLVPSEVIVAYPVLKSSAAEGIADWALPLTAWILLAVVVVLRWHATATPDRAPQWPAIALSAASFIIWVNVIDGSFGILTIAKQFGFQSLFNWSSDPKTQHFLSSLALVLWTLIVPIIYKGDNR